MKKNEENFTLTEEEKDFLTQALLERQSNAKKKRTALTKELQVLVRKAANSNDEEMKSTAALLVYEATELVALKYAMNYVEQGRTELDDFKSELYIIIKENLHDYNGIHSVSTFITPLINRYFMALKDKARGITDSRYFRDLGPYISKAINEMKAMGLEKPTYTDISDFCRIRKKKTISEATIEQWLTAHRKTSSIDDLVDVLSDDNDSYNPESSLMKKEDIKEFYDAVDKTSKKSKELLLKEVQMINKKGFIPSAKMIHAELLKEGKLYKLHEVEMMINQAHNELKLAIKGYASGVKRAEVNFFEIKAPTEFDLACEQAFIDALNNSLEDMLPFEGEGDW